MIKFMPQRDPMEELFRQNAHRLEQRPSLQTWRRLERRLDRQKGRNSRNFHLPPLLLYAAVILFLGVMMIALLQLPNKQDRSLAQRPESIEELDLSPFHLPRAEYYQGIQEGNTNETLQVRNSGIPTLMPAEKYRL